MCLIFATIALCIGSPNWAIGWIILYLVFD